MRTINITLTDKAHANLKAATDMMRKNQSEVVSKVFERIDVVNFVRELRKEELNGR